MTPGIIFDIIWIKMWKVPQAIKGNNMEVEQVAAELAKHEAICAERWKTVFNNLEHMERGAEKRFNGIDDQNSKIETIILSSAGFLIVTLVGVVGTMLSMH